MKRLFVTLTVLAACQDSLVEDGADDSFLDEGKSDSGGIREGSSPGYAVLRIANEADSVGFDDAGLSSLTAQNILAHRVGPDGQLGTADDDRFDTLAELDAVPYVGPVAFQKLLANATALGYIVYDWRTHIIYPTVSTANRTLCTVTGPADATEMRLMFDGTSMRLDLRNTSYTVVQTIGGGFRGWSDPIPGNRVTYQVFSGGSYLDCEQFTGILQAVAVKEPLAVDDPFRFATQIQLSSPTPTDAMAGGLGLFALPNLLLLDQISKSSSTSCAHSQTTIRYTPPTDGVYTFKSFDNRFVAIRDGGSEGPELACGGRETSVKLHGGQPLAIAVGTNVPSFTWVEIYRARQEASCDDAFDDDGDGDIDCDDADCAEACRTKEVCTNGIDDNGNGKTDCLDGDCATSTSCSSNTCPGDDLGSATSTTTPVAAGNATLAQAEEFLACGSTALPWDGSRFYRWKAPAAGTYRFTVDGTGLYDWGVKLLDGTCDGDVLACGAHSSGGAGALRTMTANQSIVIEVGFSRGSVTDTWTPFTLSIRPN